jgi:hypothetical protein
VYSLDSEGEKDDEKEEEVENEEEDGDQDEEDGDIDEEEDEVEVVCGCGMESTSSSSSSLSSKRNLLFSFLPFPSLSGELYGEGDEGVVGGDNITSFSSFFPLSTLRVFCFFSFADLSLLPLFFSAAFFFPLLFLLSP